MKAQYTVYKSDISYFSGKLEAYLRYKNIPHALVDIDQSKLTMLGQKTGIMKMPAIEMADGNWLFDTTPTIQYLEQQHPQNPVLPDDQALRFLALLIEDYSDEWLWRPAMWWRWVPKVSRAALGRRIASSMMTDSILSIPLGFLTGRRQLKEWIWGDGVDQHNSNQVRDMLYRELEFLEPLLAQQPFILGSHPSVADLGYFGSMFRHFGNDPISGEVMRREGPNTCEWLARMWNAKPESLNSENSGTQQWQWPEADYWQPLLSRIAKDYLPYLHQNALAFREGKKHFDYSGQSLSFNSTITTHYRAWCREQLQAEFSALSESDQSRVTQLFERAGGLDSLHQDGVIRSGMDNELSIPKPEQNKQVLLRMKIFGQARN